MKQSYNKLSLPVDTMLHLTDLTRHCDKNKVSYQDAIAMGTRFIHTFYDKPIHPKYKVENYDYLTRLKMFNMQL